MEKTWEVRPPFIESHQLNDQLRLVSSASLARTDGELTTLPGQARVELSSSGLDRYIKKELLVPTLDQLAPWLWLVSTPRFSHISPLHHQAIRGRDIVLTENPQLHLVYYYDKIFIKPIPRYLLSYAFWQYLGNQSNALREAAIGFMRTYSYLVQYESDFILAQSKGLLPRNDIITFESFARFVNAFDGFTDEDVCPRYSYGELRLTRLNFYTRILLRKLAFHPVNVQWGTVLNGFVTPLITIFAIASVVLNAMQVYLAVSNLSVVSENAALVGASQWFSVVVLIFSAALTGILLCLITFFFFHGIWFARSILYKKKKDVGGDKWKNKKSVVV